MVILMVDYFFLRPFGCTALGLRCWYLPPPFAPPLMANLAPLLVTSWVENGELCAT